MDVLELKRVCDAVGFPLIEFARQFEEGCGQYSRLTEQIIHFGVRLMGYLCWLRWRSSAQRAIRKQRERKIFLDLLRELRKQKGLTQGQLAKGIGAKQAFVSKYETGERRLDFLDLVAICDVLAIPIIKFAERFESVRKSVL